jgi:DNA-binding response OmpR family regulator
MRILYLEDNPLIVFHVEQMVEDLGHQFVGSLSSFSELIKQFDSLSVDAALVDIDLADGTTGPAAAEWLKDRGIPGVFVTGQKKTADKYAHLVLGTVVKPIAPTELAAMLDLVGRLVSRER